jgi:hypothetical protein
MSTSFALTHQGDKLYRQTFQRAYADIEHAHLAVLEMHTCWSNHLEYTLVRVSPPVSETAIGAIIARVGELVQLKPTPLEGFSDSLLVDDQLLTPLGTIIRKTIRKSVSRDSFYDSPDEEEIDRDCMLWEPKKPENQACSFVGFPTFKHVSAILNPDYKASIRTRRDRIERRLSALRGFR